MSHIADLAFARELDARDTLKGFREKFFIPTVKGKEAVYLCGNSLGLQPKTARTHIDQELADWANLGVEAHFDGKNPWFYYHKFTQNSLASIVGAQPDEVVAMGSLTNNLHLLLVSFYRPTATRYKIVMEAGAFPSDQYAIESQVRLHGFDPATAIIELTPRSGEYTLHTEDIVAAIMDQGESIACVMLGGVNYFTGQFFELDKITLAAHSVGATCGFDLAHTVGNIPLQLHNWEADFACWCSYKYLNSGPGAIAGIFIHEKHHGKSLSALPRFAGWWGYPEDTRFKMEKGFKPMPGAAAWQLSNAPVFPMALLKSSLDIYDAAGTHHLRAKSLEMTGYLHFLIEKINAETTATYLRIITPADPHQRGCQLSIIASNHGKTLFNALTEEGILADWREPNVIRMSPVPLYNTFEDCYKVYEALKQILPTLG